MSEFNPLDWDVEDEGLPLDPDHANAYWPGLADVWARVAPAVCGSALQVHAPNCGNLKLGDVLTWESQPKPWSIWRFWRKAKAAQLNTFVVTSVT